MNNEKLGEIINEISETVEGANGRWQFVIDSTMFICLTDENHNRMRPFGWSLMVYFYTPTTRANCGASYQCNYTSLFGSENLWHALQ